VSALADVAARWTDPEHPPRQRATEEALAGDARFTEEGIAFAVNHGADLIASGELETWAGTASGARSVGVLVAGRAPWEGVLEAAAALAAGHRVVLARPAGPLAEAFFRDVGEGVTLGSRDDVFGADAVIGLGTAAEVATWAETAEKHGIAPERRLFREVLPGVAVLDGREDAAALSGLAEDLLLHEAAPPGAVRLVWAPDGLDPDALLDQLSGFREVFPAHPSTDGALAMRAAFLAAARQPHASGPGFLVSKGAPEEQDGTHVRWVGYADVSEPAAWVAEHRDRAGAVTARPAVADALRAAGLPADVPVLAPGDAHRPEPGRFPLDAPLAAFLRA